MSLPGARPRAGIRLGRSPAETSKTGRNLAPFGSVPKWRSQTAPPVFVSLPGARPRAGIRLGRWPADTSKTGRNLPPFGSVPKRHPQTAPPVFVSLPGARPRAGIRLGRSPAETSKTGRNLAPSRSVPFGSVPKRRSPNGASALQATEHSSIFTAGNSECAKIPGGSREGAGERGGIF
jgi:hypothetical protein